MTALAFPKKTPRRRIDKSALAIPVFLPWRSGVHLGHVGAHRCCFPGCNLPAEVHHLLSCPELKARGRKCSDYWTIPLCAGHHRGPSSVHMHGNEEVWSLIVGIDRLTVAIILQQSSPVAEAIARHMRGNT